MNIYHRFLWLWKGLINHKYSRLARLDRPASVYLPMFPALWAVALSAKSWSALIGYSLVMAVGAIAAKSAGCIINDLWDQKIDAEVERTKLRPLASGEVTRQEAYKLLAVFGILSLAVLFCLPWVAIIIGLCAIPMIAIYPLLKRATFYPQVFLGFVYNIGVLVAWYSVSPHFSYQAVMLYIAGVLWTIGYDTIYGHQDRVDDLAYGVKSLSIKMGDKTADGVWSLYQMMMLLIVISAMGAGVGLLFYPFAAIATYYLYWQTVTLDINNPQDCADKFRSNIHVGLLLWIGMLLGKVL